MKKPTVENAESLNGEYFSLALLGAYYRQKHPKSWQETMNAVGFTSLQIFVVCLQNVVCAGIGRGSMKQDMPKIYESKEDEIVDACILSMCTIVIIIAAFKDFRQDFVACSTDSFNSFFSYCQYLASGSSIAFALATLIRISKKNELILDVLGLLLVLEIDDLVAHMFPLLHPIAFENVMCDKQFLKQQKRLTAIDPFDPNEDVPASCKTHATRCSLRGIANRLSYTAPFAWGSCIVLKTIQFRLESQNVEAQTEKETYNDIPITFIRLYISIVSVWLLLLFCSFCTCKVADFRQDRLYKGLFKLKDAMIPFKKNEETEKEELEEIPKGEIVNIVEFDTQKDLSSCCCIKRTVDLLGKTDDGYWIKVASIKGLFGLSSCTTRAYPCDENGERLTSRHGSDAFDATNDEQAESPTSDEDEDNLHDSIELQSIESTNADIELSSDEVMAECKSTEKQNQEDSLEDRKSTDIKQSIEHEVIDIEINSDSEEEVPGKDDASSDEEKFHEETIEYSSPISRGCYSEQDHDVREESIDAMQWKWLMEFLKQNNPKILTSKKDWVVTQYHETFPTEEDPMPFHDFLDDNKDEIEDRWLKSEVGRNELLRVLHDKIRKDPERHCVTNERTREEVGAEFEKLYGIQKERAVDYIRNPCQEMAKGLEAVQSGELMKQV